MEQKMIWCISKQRGGKILIHKVFADLSYNGQRIPIMPEDKEELREIVYKKHNLSLTPNKEVALLVDKRFNESAYKDLTRFIARKLYSVKRNKPELYNVVRSEKIPCYFEGTCKLLRSSSKDVIWIALRQRTKKFPHDYTNLNRICIDDYNKQLFFKDADALHIPYGKKHYITAADGRCFMIWSKYMDDQYTIQLNAYKESKRKEKVEKE